MIHHCCLQQWWDMGHACVDVVRARRIIGSNFTMSFLIGTLASTSTKPQPLLKSNLNSYPLSINSTPFSPQPQSTSSCKTLNFFLLSFNLTFFTITSFSGLQLAMLSANSQSLAYLTCAPNTRALASLHCQVEHHVRPIFSSSTFGKLHHQNGSKFDQFVFKSRYTRVQA